MNENTGEALVDLLIKRATYGLSDAEQAELDALENGRHDDTFDLTVSAISLIGQKDDDAMPSHLRANIRASAERHFDEIEEASIIGRAPEILPAETAPGRSGHWNWLGWTIAAAACLALVANVYLTRIEPGPQVGIGPTPTPAEETASVASERQKFMTSASDMVKAVVTKGTIKEISDVTGDIVWSDSKQEGYMVFRGLPVNDKEKTTYQLWIYDSAQDKKTPVSGGVFDVDQNGEVIIQIKPALKVLQPSLFAVTMEKPGGVMVSDGKYVAALGKIET